MTVNHPRRALLQVLVIVGALVAALGLTATPASAAQVCNAAADRDMCLWVDALGGGIYRVHVGIDVPMTETQAQEYIDDPLVPFEADVWGDDGHKIDAFLFSVRLVSLQVGRTTTGRPSLAGDFEVLVTGNTLDEDPPGQEDEIRARVLLIDRDTNLTTGVFISDQMSGRWPM